MSKKSRKRNKKILAAIGIGLGAAALASKRKKELGDTETTSRMGNDFTKSTKPTIADVSNTAKKDTAVKTKTTIQDNKPKKNAVVAKKPIPGIRIGDDGSITSSKFDKKSPNTTYANKNDYVNRKSTVVEPAKKSIGDTLSYNSTFAQNQRKNAPVTGTTLPGQSLRSGGRAGYKSGGKIKGCGKALRGFGKAMKGKR